MSTAAWLIMSGAFVGSELAAEFGQLPPAFLPVGTRRLYEHQLEKIDPALPVYMTLPESFEIPAEDLRLLAGRNVQVLPLPEALSLGEAVIFALNLIAAPDQSLMVLHGDTLVRAVPETGSDWVGTVAGWDRYSWAEAELDGEVIVGLETVAAGVNSESERPIVCGLFSFAHSSALVRSLTRARGEFIAGVLDYGKAHPLRAVSILDCYDFGHVQTYFRSRRVVTSARHFNALRIDGKTARKTSHDAGKIRAEADWFANVPSKLRIFCARLIDAGDDETGAPFYETEYGYLPTLAELFVFGKVGRPAWIQMLQGCQDFLTACAGVMVGGAGGDDLGELATVKTMTRLAEHASRSGFDVDAPLRYGRRPMPSLMRIARDIADELARSPRRPACVMHGDFCFSNILYDSRVRRVHVIDPRGYVRPGRATIYGDTRYDMAKLAHSIVGRYDQIIAGRYRSEARDGQQYEISFEAAPHHVWLEQTLGDLKVAGVAGGGREVRLLTVCLFLSMLPLHADRPDRQRAFIANALRLHAELDGANS